MLLKQHYCCYKIIATHRDGLVCFRDIVKLDCDIVKPDGDILTQSGYLLLFMLTSAERKAHGVVETSKSLK